jgi:hypothetical protein
VFSTSLYSLCNLKVQSDNPKFASFVEFAFAFFQLTARSRHKQKQLICCPMTDEFEFPLAKTRIDPDAAAHEYDLEIPGTLTDHTRTP